MPTIQDVAILAGVSKATVSRSLNQPELVDECTRERVMQAINTLNFTPNALARGLATGKSGIVGLIVPDITNPYFGYIAKSCSDEFKKHQLTIALYDTYEQSSQEYYTRSLIQKSHADGLVIMSESASVSKVVNNLSPSNTPTVYIERVPDQPNIDGVWVDNKRAARLAAEHLIGLGHRKIAVVTGLLNTITGTDRLQGFSESLHTAGIPLPDEYIFQGNFKLEGGVSAATHFLSLKEPPTAVFISNDLMAYGAIGEFISNGWHVPEDISVVGCEGFPLSEYFPPKLTTIAIPTTELGRHASRLLLKRMEKPNRKSVVEILNVEIVIRQSTIRAK